MIRRHALSGWLEIDDGPDGVACFEAAEVVGMQRCGSGEVHALRLPDGHTIQFTDWMTIMLRGGGVVVTKTPFDEVEAAVRKAR